jgi:predicted MFS family arabinose efflux permease
VPLILGRLAFGLALGIVWTTGVAWLSSAGDKPHLGAVATNAAVGMAAGPAIGGVLADALGLASPFLVVGALSAVLALALGRQPAAHSNRPPQTSRSGSLRLLAHTARHSRGVVTAAAVLAVAGGVGGVIQLLVPLQLHQAGFSASATGPAYLAAIVPGAIAALTLIALLRVEPSHALQVV